MVVSECTGTLGNRRFDSQPSHPDAKVDGNKAEQTKGGVMNRTQQVLNSKKASVKQLRERENSSYMKAVKTYQETEQ